MEKVSRALGLLEQKIRERDERIALLEHHLRERDKNELSASSSLLSELFGHSLSEKPQEASTTQSKEVEQSAVVMRPVLSSRLSASGTDFSSFSKRLAKHPSPMEPPAVSSHSSEADLCSLVPVPRAAGGAGAGNNSSGSASNSPNLANRRMHLNDLNSLAVKSRRQQKQHVQLSESSDVLDEGLADLLRSPEAAPPASEQRSFGLSPPPIPVGEVSPGPSPVPSGVARAHTHSTLTRAAVLPVETVRAALLERAQSGALSPPASTSPTGHGEESGHRKRSSLALKNFFKSAFPKKQGVLFEASGPIALTAADGGFLSHNANFNGRPLFGSAPLFRVEAYADSDGSWTFPFGSVSLPSSFQLVLERKDRQEPKVWIWEQEAFILVVWFLHVDYNNPDTPNCVYITISAQGGIRKAATRICNLHLMSSEERTHHVLSVCAGPMLPPEKGVRVKTALMGDLWPRLLELEKLLARRVVEVDFCELVPLGLDRKSGGGSSGGGGGTGSRRASLTGSRNGQKQNVVLNALSQKSEQATGQDFVRSVFCFVLFCFFF